MKKKSIVLSTGFALFAMFFGSGNLVFPITVGLQSQGHYLLAAVGILLTGVVVPFLGVLGMMLYRGELPHFFRFFGRRGVLLFSFLSLALMGPFGVLARCLTVAHGALLLLFPTISLPVASALFCGIIFLFTVNKSKIIPLLGNFLTPFLLLSIGGIALFALAKGSFPESSLGLGVDALKNGFLQGYQTMDLLAAFFFSQFVIGHLFRYTDTHLNQKGALKTFLWASLVGGGILALVYFLLVLLGALYAPMLAEVPPQAMLGIIAMHALGPLAAPFVCIAIIFACLTTAIVLASLFADFLRKEVMHGRMGNAPALIGTLLIGFLVSNLEFAGIAKFLGPLLEMIYPALIALTLYNIAVSSKKKWATSPDL